MNKQTLILILSCNHPIYQKLAKEGIDKTWNSIHYDHMPTYYYSGESDACYHDNRNIYLTSQDFYGHITEKTIQAFEYALNNFTFDYIFRTNSSSYINKDRLNTWLQDKPISDFYAGIIGEYRGIKYASGCGYTISRNLVEKIVSHKDRINLNFHDDVILGKFLNQEIVAAPRKDTSCNTSMNYDIENHFHWRCKCPSDRNVDIQHMRNIHQLITEKQ